MAQQGYTPEEMKEFRKAFDLFDKDRNGKITCRELRAVMQSMGQTPSEDQVKDMLRNADKDESGTIEFNEFVQLLHKNAPTANPVQELVDAFRVFDKNGDGHITAQELRTVMTSMGERLSPEEVEQMITEADVNRDGVIDYDEFVKMITAK